MKDSKFRLWLQEIWIQNCDEHSEYHEPNWTIAQYWANYKWWLKRKFQLEQLSKGNSQS